MSFVLTVGKAADSPQFVPVLHKVRIALPVGRPRKRPDAVAADKPYSSRANRFYLRKRNIKAVIPEKEDQAANRKRRAVAAAGPHATTPLSARDGTPVERLINKLKAGGASRLDTTRHPRATSPTSTSAPP